KIKFYIHLSKCHKVKKIRRMHDSDRYRLRNACAIFINEISMLSSKQLNYFDLSFRSNLKNYNYPFGGKLVVLGEDFRQCLPIFENATRGELISSTILSSNYFTHSNQVKKINLYENMRTENGEKEFAQFLLQIGNGEKYDSSISYPLNGRMDNHRFITIPEKLIFEGDNVQFIEEIFGITTDLLNTFTSSEYPEHNLTIAKRCILICLRNLNIKEGLCNGTRMVYIETIESLDKMKKLLKYKALDGSKPFLIPQILHTPVDLKISISCKTWILDKHWIILGFVDDVGIFAHGQLYVALSRAKSSSSIKVKWNYTQSPNKKRKLKNVIIKSIIDLFLNPLEQLPLPQDMPDIEINDNKNNDEENYNSVFVKMMEWRIANAASKPSTVDLMINFKMLTTIIMTIISTRYLHKNFNNTNIFIIFLLFSPIIFYFYPFLGYILMCPKYGKWGVEPAKAARGAKPH
uniref:ATP-dependent DNA helicase n=1 Tax=Strongyloides stercoralis TaxID=6248 RepID=A0AAF5DPK2_STRER